MAAFRRAEGPAEASLDRLFVIAAVGNHAAQQCDGGQDLSTPDFSEHCAAALP